MSRLIRDSEENKQEQGQSSGLQLPLSNSAVLTHLKACQSLAAEHSRQAFRQYIKVLDDALTLEISQAKSNQESMELQDVQRQLRQGKAELERYFCGYLSEGFVKFKKKELNTSVNADTSNPEELSLIGNDELEEAIAISSITQRADEYFAEPLWALNQRFSVLNGGQRVTESNNPTSPIQFCESLRKALKLVPMNTKVKNLAYKLYDDQLINIMQGISEEVNRYLKQNEILPNLKYAAPSGSVPASTVGTQTQDVLNQLAAAQASQGQPEGEETQDPNEYQGNLVQAIRNLQNQMLVPGVAQQAGLPPNGVLVSGDSLVGALQNLQSQAVQGGGLPSGEGNQQIIPLDISQVISRLKEEISSENQDAEVEQHDMQTIDLVGMVFEYMLNDANLPDSIKALLSYLHTPFLKIAFIDPGFFEQADHPARVLLNSLAEAGSKWVGNDGTSQYDIYNKIKDIVNRILKDFESDIKIITELLLEFKSYTKNIIRRQELMEKRATEKAQGEEKLREVKLRVNDEIRARTEKKELPSAVLLFLLQPWSDYLSFALLRYGEKSDKWIKAVALVDDVLWCIEPKTHEQDRSRQMELHSEVVSAISNGFETIGYDQEKGKKLIDALSSLIKLALQSKKAEPAPAPMRNKLERIAAEKAGTKETSETRWTPEEEQMVESLKMIEFGTWFEFEGGRRLKVAWYNARTSHYMLVDQMGKRVDMMSGLMMARQMISGKAKIISGSSKPFFERALENILEKLNEKADSASDEAKGKAAPKD